MVDGHEMVTAVWWCDFERRSIPTHQQGEDIGYTRACGPQIQCTGGRRNGLVCGWHWLTPVDEECMAPECEQEATIELRVWDRPCGRVCGNHATQSLEFRAGQLSP